MATLNEELEEEAQKQTRYAIDYLDIFDKQSMEHLLYYVQVGRISCSQAAEEIIKRINAQQNLYSNQRLG